MTASLHRAEDVATEIHRRIAFCTTGQGAETDIGTSVFHGRRTVDPSMIPCASIIEADDTPKRGRVKDEVELDQRYVVFAYLPCDANNPNLAAHAAIRDLKRALFALDGAGDMRLGGKVKAIEYLGRDMGARADGSSYVVGAIEFMVTYVERLSAP